MQLSEIEGVLEQEGFATHFEPAADADSLDRLLVAREAEAEEVLELLFVPSDGELESVRLLQFFIDLRVSVRADLRGAVQDLLARLNQTLPLIGFQLHEEPSTVVFRYVLVVPAAGSPVVIPETVWMIYFMIHQFRPEIERVAEGGKINDPVPGSD